MKTIDELVCELKGTLNVQQPIIKTPIKEVKSPIEDKPKQEVKAAVTAAKSDKAYKMTLAMAKEIAKAVEIAAGIMGVNAVVAVKDEGANLVLLHAMDDSYIASVNVAQDKAYTAVALKMPTHKALEESRGGSLDGLANGNGIMLLGGGYPLKANGKIYGGVGVSGGTKEQDTALAMVAERYFKIRFA